MSSSLKLMLSSTPLPPYIQLKNGINQKLATGSTKVAQQHTSDPQAISEISYLTSYELHILYTVVKKSLVQK